MRKTVVLLLLLGFSLKTNCQNCEFENLTHDFGNICVKERHVTHKFLFKNKGEEPLIIKAANARCGCIETVFSAQPVAVGDTGSVYIRYHISSTGVFNKRIKVITNGNNCFITIKGNCYREKKH